MARKSKLIDDNTLKNAKKMLEYLGDNAKGVIKLKAIIASKEHGISLVAKVFNVSRNSITTWINKFKNNANGVFSIESGRGRKNLLAKEQLETIKIWVVANPNLTLRALAQKIESNFAVKYTIPGVQKIIKKLSLGYIMPRPKHYKQEESTRDEFKKPRVEIQSHSPE